MRRHPKKVNRTRLARRKIREWVVLAHERLLRACGGAPERLGHERPITDQLTSWQRCQWARAGYPGLSGGHIDAARVRPFLERQRRR